MEGDMDDLETKRKMYGDLKQFAKAEMGREIGARHGRSVKLPWDAETEAVEVEPDDESVEPDGQDLSQDLGQVDPEALQALLDALDKARPKP